MKQLGITSLAPIRLQTCMVEATGANSNETRHDQLDTLFRCLARSKRRRIVGFVFEHAPDPVPQDELATMLAAWTHGKSYEDVTGEERQRVAGKLRHVHLPSLAAAGLVEHDTEDHTVSLTEHPAFEDPAIREIIGDDPSDSPESLDAFFRAIAEGRRRTCLEILSHQFGSIHVETLARELAASGRDVRPSEVPAEDADSVVTTLSHVDLPHLSDAGLVEYDAADAMVAYAGHPHLRVPWMHSVLRPEFRPSLTGESNPEGVGEIEGREQVVSASRCATVPTRSCSACSRTLTCSKRAVSPVSGTPHESGTWTYISERATRPSATTSRRTSRKSSCGNPTPTG